DRGDDPTLSVEQVDIGNDALKRRNINLLADIFGRDGAQFFGRDELGLVEDQTAQDKARAPARPHNCRSPLGADHSRTGLPRHLLRLFDTAALAFDIVFNSARIDRRRRHLRMRQGGRKADRTYSEREINGAASHACSIPALRRRNYPWAQHYWRILQKPATIPSVFSRHVLRSFFRITFRLGVSVSPS